MAAVRASTMTRTAGNLSSPEVRAGSRLGSFTIVGVLGAVGLMAALHVLDPALDPVQRPTSEYAIGPFGPLMTAVFLSLSGATWALIVGLRRDLDPAAVSRSGLALLAVWGVGLLVAAAFPIDPEGGPATVGGTIHAIAGPVTFVSLVAGMVLVSRRLVHDARWERIRRIVRPLALLTLLEFVIGGAARAAGTGAGMVQRLMLLTVAAWFVLVARGLRQDTRDAS